MSERAFETSDGKRERVPLLVGLAGPSGSGKTFSALRLATGMQRITGGDIHVIDTEARRALHYADSFTFKHTPFGAPFSPDDYLKVIEHCTKQGASVIVVDSTSHEHEGPGGVLEWHETELDRMAGNDYKKRERMTFAAWAKPKAARRRLINSIVQLGVNAVFCFRAKPKLKLQTGEKPVDLGWMPIGGDEYVYEMALHCLLYPHSDGVPTWDTKYPGEKQMMKLPAQFRGLFTETAPLSEDLGQALAEWASGGAATKAPTQDDLATLLDEIREAPSKSALAKVAKANIDLAWSVGRRAAIKEAISQRKGQLAKPADEALGDQSARTKRGAQADQRDSTGGACEAEDGAGAACIKEKGHSGEHRMVETPNEPAQEGML